MLKKNEQKAEELTMTWIDKWNNSTNNVDLIESNKNVIIIMKIKRKKIIH